jgi:hypothetical protein
MTTFNLLSTTMLDATVGELRKAQKIVQISIGSNERGFVVTDAIGDAIHVLQGFLDHRSLKEAVEKLSRHEMTPEQLIELSHQIQSRRDH